MQVCVNGFNLNLTVPAVRSEMTYRVFISLLIVFSCFFFFCCCCFNPIADKTVLSKFKDCKTLFQKMGTLSGRVTLPFSFGLPSQCESTLRGKEFTPLETNYFFISRLYLRKALLSLTANWMYLFVKWRENADVYNYMLLQCYGSYQWIH